MRVSTAVAAATSALLIAAGKAPSAVATLPVVDGSMGIEDEFGQWMATYSKEYGAGERDARKGIWMENRGRVIAHNRAAADGKYSFTLELNHLADMTNAEYRMKLLGLGGAGPATLADHTFQGNGSVPDAWDWRDTPNVVNPVKNQGQCGSCWAFSAVATMEGAYNLEQKSLNSFSEQELVDCVDGGADNCNVGGEMYKGVAYGVKNGMMHEKDYPYEGSSGNKCRINSKEAVKGWKGYTNITSGDENALKIAAYKQPIVSVGIDASSFFFQLYFGGVYDNKSCKKKAAELDHGVAVVGYGHDSSAKKDYWWVRNSWGGFWGLKGYIKMARNEDNQCGIATQACFATV